MGFLRDVATHQEDSVKIDPNINKIKASPLGSTCEGSDNGPRFATNGASHNDPNDAHPTGNAPITPPIAIVGMAVRLPGDVRSMESFWDLLISKRDVSTEVPGSRFNIDAYYSDSRPMTVKSRRGFFLSDELDKVDPSVFGMSSDKAGLIDPQQRLLLELVWECMESAGQTNWRGTDIGTYVGNFGEDWLEMCLKDPVAMQRHQVFAASDFSLSSRVSYEYDLRGPSMTIRTACSASMIALHEACQSVASGECSGAIVAGSNIILTPTMTTNMSENMVISVDGECRTFDADANGYARGECVNAIYIKKLDQAIQDGDPIRAVIRSTTANSNGRTSKPAVPSAEAQSNLIRKAYQRAGILDPTKTGLFECHGTGTAAGDVTEAEAIARVFGASGVVIGAAKPNVGHSEGASALTSLIKGVLCLEHRAIPPSARFETPNPRIPFKEANLRVAKELLPWPEDRDERVSVNSFGIGGSNAHAILESARSWTVGSTSTESSLSANDSSKLVIVSAMSQESLDQKLVQLAAYCRDQNVACQDLAYTLGERRDHWRHRAFAVVQQGAVTELPVFKKHHSSSQKPQSMIFVFPGQGSQWPGMGKRLFETFGCFREAIRTMDRVLQSLPQPPTWTLEESSRCYVDKITTIDDASCFVRAEYSQPLCAAVQIGLVDLLASWNIHPTAVIGHSSGEMVAAYAAKSITAETAIMVAYYRGQASGSHKKRGGMASIGLGRDAIKQYLEDGVVLACENSLQSVVVSGDQDALVRVLDRVKEAHPDIFTGRLEVETAYHSRRLHRAVLVTPFCFNSSLPDLLIASHVIGTNKKTDHMTDVGPELEKMLHDRIQFCTPEISFYSTVYGRVLTEADRLDAQYWRRNLESTVLFQTAVKTALENLQEDTSFLLEIGPHCSLSGPVRQIIRDVKPKSPVHYFPTLHRAQDEVSDALEAAGQLFLQGLPISLPSINGPGKLLTDLPPYPWNYSKSAKFENRVANSWRHRQFCHHELLGSRATESSDLEPFWRNILSLENSAWLCDHKFSQYVVYPAAAHIAAVGEAVRQMTGATAFSIRHLFIKKALLLDVDKDVELATSLKSSFLTDLLDSDWFDFTISSFNGTEWTKHCTGQVSGVQQPESTVKVVSSFIRKVDASGWYKSFRRIGLDYGPYFQGLDNVTADPVKTVAAGTISRSENLPDVGGFAIHPTLIDKALQLVAVAATRGISRDLDRVAIPISIDKIFVETCTSADLEAEADCRGITDGNFTGDVSVTQNNNVVLDIRGVRCFPMDEDSSGSSDSQFSRVIWKEDIEFLPSLSGILPPSPARYEAELLLTERVCVLYMMKLYRSIKDTTPKDSHFVKYINWLDGQVKRFEAGEHTVVPETKAWAKMSVEDQELIHSSLQSALAEMGPKWAFFVEFMNKINRAGHELAEGRINPLELLMEDNGLEKIYSISAGLTNYDGFLKTLSHSKPSMKILEVGAGTGSTTANVLSSLQTPDLGRLYSEYFFTDISPGFFAPARERFQQFSGIIFKPLDITHDPVGQGFQEGYFDLIIASNVLHATPCLIETLLNVRKLLAPGGYLLLQELHPESIRVDCVMGLLPQWWLGGDDGRPEKPHVSPDRWDKELQSAGFTGVESTSYDNVWPHHSSASMISRIQHSTTTDSPNVSFLYEGTFSKSAKMIEQAFLQDGYNVNWFTLKGSDLSHEHVVSLLDLDTPFFEDISEADFIAFRTFMATSAPKSMLWITRDTQMRCADPRWSLTLGMMRTLRLEFSIPCATFEMTSADQATLSSLVKVQQKIQSSPNSALDPDYEYSSEGEKVFTGRYYPGQLSTTLGQAYEQPESKKLTIATCGLLGTIQWERFEPQPPGNGELEIDIKYVGLNFKDLMHIMGFIGQKDDIGLEATGVVRRIGPGPHREDFQEGDQVLVCGYSLLRTSAVISSHSCIRLPPGLSLEDAATVSVAFCTVIYSLITLGGLRKGQSVLIHSAAGGVGLAAIQISRLLDAEKLGLFSRSGNNTEKSSAFVQELEAMGCTANVVVGDVVHMEDVMRAISSCPKPLAGVIQLAMVIKDQTFLNMEHEDWLAALAPKVTGTRNLYRAIKNHNKLDFFLMFSSIVGICGNIGQSNYAAANCFLDAFAKVCRAEGCPACVIQLGGMAGIGYISQRPVLKERYNESIVDLLQEKDLLQAVQVAIEQARLTGTNQDDPSASTVVIGLQQFVRSIPREAYRRDRRFASCLPSVEKPTSTPLETDRINKFLADMETDPSILELPSTLDLLIEEIATIINGQSGEFESLEAAGEIEVDSLMTIEIRSWVRKRLNIEISTLHISKAKNVRGLALLIIEHLKSSHSSKDGERQIDEKTGGGGDVQK
ncbi:fatty acid synthase S-acetyltransferase [Penicillium sp. IBT 35674x]|nr:fatty acid synthase S-acetyltransferase [Penicillium sp. IBT 35674x]